MRSETGQTRPLELRAHKSKREVTFKQVHSGAAGKEEGLEAVSELVAPAKHLLGIIPLVSSYILYQDSN